jgi:hypothetical protein
MLIEYLAIYPLFLPAISKKYIQVKISSQFSVVEG